MALERTFSIIKPDAVKRNLIGEIYSRFEKAGLAIVGARMLKLTGEQAGGFTRNTTANRFMKTYVPT